MSLQSVHPEGWETPSGYSNGIVAPAGARLLFIAGQIAWDADQTLVGRGDFVAQFRQALANVLAVVDAAGGEARHLASVTVYVVEKEAYLAKTKEIGAVWREMVGRHWPAMALVEVKGLLERDAVVEIQAVAALG